MKKILTMAALCVVALAAHAQTEKGKTIVGGTIGYSNTKFDYSDHIDETTKLTLLPSIGYFVKNNLALGLGIGYSNSRGNNSSNLSGNMSARQNADNFQISPYARYYVNISEKFKFFSQLSIPVEWGNSKIIYDNDLIGSPAIPMSKVNTSSIGVQVEPGLAYFPTKRIGIQLSIDGLAYFWNKTKNTSAINPDTDENHAFSLGASFFAPRIGIQFHF
ncbi:outer membrane beta-barrel protein [Pedobacter cryoconitis]|uniref:Opacity protein-like surface antigen n=1 Tax=Pedobacter cryoconitis TaxID=188932 RepID=A0A7X0J2U0_9SPHI|nr:outer membrane beta-barrel protein [Pedobacter cryoconitis]MBB6500023.1 opacity protein-like surface antigen [Pedobacter cryoconitis]